MADQCTGGRQFLGARRLIGPLCLLLLAPTLQAEWSVSPDTRNVFADSELALLVSVANPDDNRLAWQVVLDRATLHRGEAALAGRRPVNINIKTPTVRPGHVLSAEMLLSTTSSTRRRPLWIFSPEPFADRQALLKQHNLHLWAPNRAAAELLETAGIPFQSWRPGKAAITRVTVLVASGFSARAFSQGWPELQAAAAAGANVICFAPELERLPLPEALAAIETGGFERIRRLDKRLDALPGAQTYRFAAFRSQVVIESADDEGWTWMEFVPGNGTRKAGRILILGYDPFIHWDERPAAPYLLRALLE